MKKRIRQLAIFTFSVTFGVLGIMNISSAQPTGILGLYQNQSKTSPVINGHKLQGLGCELRRKGMIANEQGDIDIDEPNHFAILACDSSLLQDANKRIGLEKAITNAKTIALLEGRLMDFPISTASNSLSSRNYILKISHYNNKNTNKREQDLTQLNQLVHSRPNRYKTEAFIEVTNAMGMPTPDEVVVLYYDRVADGEHFRKNNPDIMKRVGAFNDDHINDYIYYSGKVE